MKEGAKNRGERENKPIYNTKLTCNVVVGFHTV